MLDLDYGVKLITRAEWGARPPDSITPLNATYGATRHWEGPHMGYPWSHESCFSKVRGIQDFHMDDKGWTDIAYTGVVCPHDFVFEGRGLWVRTAANGTNDGNNRAYAFCYLGGEGDQFTEGGKRGMRAAMNWTRNHGGAGPNRNDHNDWKPTQCPGTVIETWGDSGEVITPKEEDWFAMATKAELEAIVQASEQRIIQQIIGSKPLIVAFDDVTPGNPDHWFMLPARTRSEITRDDARQAVAEGNARWWAKDEDGNWIEEPLRVPRATLESAELIDSPTT